MLRVRQKSPIKTVVEIVMTRLNTEDRQQLIRLVASFPMFGTQRGRRQILDFAGLQDLIPLVDLEGEPFVVASQIVQTSESYGRVSYGRDALGVFLNAIQEFFGGSSPERLFVQSILKQYELMTPVKEPEEITQWQGPSRAQDVLEKIVGENTLRHIAFLKRGLEVSRAVALVDAGDWVGTGFMITSTLLISNNHVLPRSETLEKTSFRFNYQLTFEGAEEMAKSYAPKAGGLFHTNPNLDYSIVELDGVPGDDWSTVSLSTRTLSKGSRVNIIQHPAGQPKQISFQNNLVEYADDTVVQYVTSTLNGSSGSPVFDDLWNVVALHHAGGILPEPQTNNFYFRNEGIAISAILNDLPSDIRASVRP